MKNFFSRNELKFARGATIILFIALIRTLAEYFKLEHELKGALTLEQVKPLVIGSLVAAGYCLIMVVFSFYRKHIVMIIVFVIAMISLMIVKNVYHIQ
ncbi:MAG TPA: hypothetical protein VM802_29285 [Chitinophaga sp.]|uniref:hypothetical protein n=1 Tax=Chitinophaga sp. TaxID=1869181 RepID=UPI002CD65EB6|nr:hypothetical protein [Chitinophaga sp.]HVI48996.1 hypothetical protein [Chitinophaga sp.]